MGHRKNPLHCRRTLTISCIWTRPQEWGLQNLWHHHVHSNLIRPGLGSKRGNKLWQELPTKQSRLSMMTQTQLSCLPTTRQKNTRPCSTSYLSDKTESRTWDRVTIGTSERLQACAGGPHPRKQVKSRPWPRTTARLIRYRKDSTSWSSTEGQASNGWWSSPSSWR